MIVVLTGAGISRASGLKTFRDSDGLWEGHKIEDVATPEAWRRQPAVVLDFYNQRRRDLKNVKPNPAHIMLAKLAEQFPLHIVTQNVDDLHERAGSPNVMHLHGQLFQVRSTKNEQFVSEWKDDLIIGDVGEDGAQLRPHIVWFGEAVPKIEEAVELCGQADILIIIGTSLQVYPAAGLIDTVSNNCKIIYVDPNPNMDKYEWNKRIEFIPINAEDAVDVLTKRINELYR